MAVTLLLYSLVGIIALIRQGCDGRNVVTDVIAEFKSKLKNGAKDDDGSCKCLGLSCQCCSKVGSSEVCNVISILDTHNATNEKPVMKLAITIDTLNIFSQIIPLEELERLCYPYGNFNMCLKFDIYKSTQQQKDKVCGNSQVQHSENQVQTENCVQLGDEQLNKHLLELLRFVSQ